MICGGEQRYVDLSPGRAEIRLRRDRMTETSTATQGAPAGQKPGLTSGKALNVPAIPEHPRLDEPSGAYARWIAVDHLAEQLVVQPAGYEGVAAVGSVCGWTAQRTQPGDKPED